MAEAYASLGNYRTVTGEWVEAELAYGKAFELTKKSITNTVPAISIHYLAVGNFIKAQELLAEEEYERATILFGNDWYFGNLLMTFVSVGLESEVSRDKIRLSTPIFDSAKEHLESPANGLAELHSLFQGNNLSGMDLISIMILAAYFGDESFAIDVLEKAARGSSSFIFFTYLPVMHEVLQTPRFKAFIKEIGLVDYWNEFGWPDICHKLDNGDFECN